MFSRALNINIEKIPAFTGVLVLGSGKLILVNSAYAGLAFFYGFFDWFSSPLEVAHLATIKEQSKEIKLIEVSQGGYTQPDMRGVCWLAVQRTPKLFNFLSNTSIKQFLTVLAMSTLTTSDLEIKAIRIVTPVAIRPVVNTAGVVLRGEETQKANV